MTEPADDGGLSALDYLRPVWRFKFVVLAVVVLATAATYFYADHKTKIYQASTQLYVGQSSLQQLLSPSATAQSDRTVADQALLATTPKVAEVVRKGLRLPASTEALRRAVSVAPDSTTDFLTITAQSTKPGLAAQLANGFAHAYLQVAGGNLLNSAQTSLRAVQQRLAQVGRGNGNAAVRTGLRQQIATLEGIVSSPPSVGQQLTPASVPSTPASPKPARDAIFAAALALVLSVIGSYVFDRSDRRVRRLDELESMFEIPVLANVPHVRHPTPTADDPYGTPHALREPLRSLRVSLDLARAATDGKVINDKVILVASALPAEGKSTVVRNLAISYREAGARVAVLEADLRRPVLAEQLGVQLGPGLSDALSGDGDRNLLMQRAPAGADQPSGGSGLIDVAVAGPTPQDPTVLLTEGRLRAMLLRLASEYDVVIIDSPPLLAVSDGLPLLSLADSVLLVVRAGTMTRPAAHRLLATIERVNRIQRVKLLGIVANDVADELAAYYGSSYGEPERANSVNAVSDLTKS
jgi:succinoglycan biosynthesis transport protein ExoP